MASTAGLLLAMSSAFAQPAAAATPTPFLQDSTIVGAGGTFGRDLCAGRNFDGEHCLSERDDRIQRQHERRAYPGAGISQDPILSVANTVQLPVRQLCRSGDDRAGKNLVTVSGPVAGPDGQTEWSLPVTATWYTGPLADNPLAARLKKAGITLSNYSYGIVGVGPPAPILSTKLISRGAA
jgi:hypothetical protein